MLSHAHEWQVEMVLKSDVFGKVVRIARSDDLAVCRQATGSWIPGSRLVAGFLIRRESRALLRLEGIAGVPDLRHEAHQQVQGTLTPGSMRILVRSWIPGVPLYATQELPRDFFDHLDRLVKTIHAAGVCHNDLHKEQNILLGEDGFPHLLDFQLASVHLHSSSVYRSRCQEDLRHAQKHRLRYLRHMAPAEEAVLSTSADLHIRRSWQSRLWKLIVKPLYNATLRRMLRWSEDEERRPRQGPWPIWTEAIGPRE